ncbi:MAG: tryptophan synthase subunit alpha [Lentisphaeria bacterium]|nr:tryptophan synthase subunit alpha [Lentisphaeria bacterium]
MNRFQKIFSRGRKVAIGYATCGCPDTESSIEFMHGMVAGGTDILELGVPFSDPTADGPVIQRSSQLALRNGFRVEKAFGIASALRKAYPELGLVLFSYYNPIFSMGPEKFAERAQQAGVDGALIVDVPFEERGEIEPMLNARGIELVPLVSPATPPERMKKITAGCGSFVYYITVRGVTGTRSALPDDLQKNLAALRRAAAPAPVAAGFGISSPETARAAAAGADGIVIGSAFVKIQLDETLSAAEKKAKAEALARLCFGAVR